MATWLVETIGAWGYSGLILLMAIESSMIPLPSEIVMIPAGYLVQQGEMNFFFVIFFATLGSLIGAWANYIFAFFVGRTFLHRYGKYFLINEDHLIKSEKFFEKHGHITTFTGRLIPVIRQLISLPAGLSKMSPVSFSFYTIIGAGIWNIILTSFGYFIGQNRILMNQYLDYIVWGTLVFVIFFIGGYWLINRK